jgi:hypothetical protein
MIFIHSFIYIYLFSFFSVLVVLLSWTAFTGCRYGIHVIISCCSFINSWFIYFMIIFLCRILFEEFDDIRSRVGFDADPFSSSEASAAFAVFPSFFLPFSLCLSLYRYRYIYINTFFFFLWIFLFQLLFEKNQNLIDILFVVSRLPFDYFLFIPLFLEALSNK